jgi:hypothetical protein
MINRKPIINGIVYRDDDKIMFISMYDEKRREIFEKKYLTLGPNNAPISENCFILVEFEEVHYRINTTPAVLTNIHYNGKDVAAKNISIDGLITSAYDAAKKYIERHKNDDINTVASDSIS